MSTFTASSATRTPDPEPAPSRSALQAGLQAGLLPDMTELHDRFAPDPGRLPDVVVELAPLEAYGALLEAGMTGDRP